MLFSFGVLGLLTVLFTQAATFSVGIEPEGGLAAGKVCLASDNSASGTDYMRFGSTCTTASLPAGVTLTDIDGGQNYFSQWSNGFPSAAADPSFFPIGVFNTFGLNGLVEGSQRGSSYKSMGINTFVGLHNGAFEGDGGKMDIQVAKEQGMYAIIEPEPESQIFNNSSFESSYGKTVTSYVYQDEVEGNTCSSGLMHVPWLAPWCKQEGDKVTVESLVAMSNQVRSRDKTRPIYQTYTTTFLGGWLAGGNGDWDTKYNKLVEASDIVAYDKYPLVDRRQNIGELPGSANGSYSFGKTWASHELVKRARDLISNRRPVWPYIETSQVDNFNETCYRPSGVDVQSLVWNAIIAGARGIAYFNNNFATCPNGNVGGGDVLLKATYQDIRAAVTTVNGQVKGLAPVINSEFANGYETHTGKINTMTKYHKASGKFYIFAAPKADGQQSVTFTLAGAPSGTVTVVNEDRTIPLSGGKFTDTFANATTTHIYKIES